MSVCIRANTVDTTDYAAIRASGYEAVISADACRAIAEVVEEEEIASCPAQTPEDEAFYGSYVPAFGFIALSECAQAEILRQLADNAEAQSIVQKAIDHRIQITFTRDCGDRQYRVRLVSELADNVDLSMSGGNWTRVRSCLDLDGADVNSDIDCGELPVAEVEQALNRFDSVAYFPDAWYRSVITKLRALVAYAKANNATSLVWA